jgi:hypothetical protein
MTDTNNTGYHLSHAMRSALATAVMGGALLTPSIAFCERYVSSLPAVETFDLNNYQDIIWLTTDNGATHEWVSDGGWNGTGAAKFHPPTTGDGRSGLGQFTHINNSQGTEQLNIRFLVYHGREWDRMRTNNKVAIMNRTDGYARPMLGEVTSNQARTYTPCDNTVCMYENGTNWPDGTETFTIGDQPENREEEWISVELEANVVTGVMRLYIFTQDGEHNGVYVEQTLSESPVGQGTPLLNYIDIIGGWFNAGTPYHTDTYYMIDELVIDDSYIGPPDGFADSSDQDPGSQPLQLTENSYVSLNPRLSSASIMSLSDNNTITAGDRTLNLDLYERGSLASPNGPVISPGTVISGTGPFDLGSVTSATDMPVHSSMLGTAFVMPHTRYNHVYHMLSPQGVAAVEISVEGTTHRLSLPQGEVINFEAGEVNGNVGAVITSDQPILASHSAIAPFGIVDASPMPPAATELWGLCSGNAYLSAINNDTHVTIYSSLSGTTRELTLNSGERRRVCDSLPWNDIKQGKGPAIHIIADKPVSAVQIADGDGAEQTAFYPTSLLSSRYGIPKDSQYIAITCPSSDTSITLYRSNGQSVTQNCNANGNHPGKAYFGNPDTNGAHIAQGSYIESSKPIHVIYEVTGSEDEHNLMGSSPYATPIFSADMEGTSPVDNWMDARTTQAGGGATITFPSVNSNRVAQFNCRAGSSNEVWLRHNFGAYPGIDEEPVQELWLNFEYLVNDTSIYNPTPGQASKILYFNWSSPDNRTRTSQVVLSAIDNGNGHRFRLSKEVFDENGQWTPGGEWLGDFAPNPIAENEKLNLQLHIRNSTNDEANGLIRLYSNGELIIERRDVLFNDNPDHSPNQLVLTPQISHTPPGSAADGHSQYDNVSLYDTDPGLFSAP